MTAVAPALVALLALSSATAQSLQVSAAAATTLVVQAGATPQTTTVPAGTLPSMQSVTTTTGVPGNSSFAALDWLGAATPSNLSFRLSMVLVVDTIGVASASAFPGDFLVSFALPAPTPVEFHLRKNVSAPVGAPVPFTRIDVGNDGTFELVETTTGPTVVVNAVVGPTPLVVRCVVAGSLNASGETWASVSINGVPPDTRLQPYDLGCTPTTYLAVPRFDGNLDVWFNATPGQAQVAVFGLALLPALLQPSCILLPAPDHLLLMPASGSATLAIPPIVRPIQFWTQGVVVGAELRTTRAYRVNAL